MTKPITENTITGMLQDLGESAANANFGLVNHELFFTEGNIADWRTLCVEMQSVLEKLDNLIERSKQPDPVPAEYIPIYGVGRKASGGYAF